MLATTTMWAKAIAAAVGDEVMLIMLMILLMMVGSKHNWSFYGNTETKLLGLGHVSEYQYHDMRLDTE